MRSFELKFRLFGIPVVIEPGFWILTVILGSTARSARSLLLWVGCVLVSVLLHELGHALVSRVFGGEPSIQLHSMGGLTHTKRTSPLTRGQSVLVSLAGPMAGFFVGLIVVAVLMVNHPAEGSLQENLAQVLLWINVGWGVINLLPMMPLDGGNVARALLSSDPHKGLQRALWLSVVVGPAVALAMFANHMVWGAVLFGLLSFGSIKQLIELRRIGRDEAAGHVQAMEQVHQALDARQWAQAEHLAGPIAEQAIHPVLRSSAGHALAIARLEQGRGEQALRALDALPSSAIDPVLRGACLLAANRAADAATELRNVWRLRGDAGVGQLLLEALEKSGQHVEAEEVREQLRAAGERRP